MRSLTSVLERLESPFLNEELLHAGPNHQIDSSELNGAWQAAEDTEVDYETPRAGPTLPTDFLKGRLWSFTAATLPIRVAIFCPKAVNLQKPLDVLLFVHGDLSPCKPVPQTMPEDLITKKPFELGKIVDSSQRSILLVVPFMDWVNFKKNALNFEACNRETMHALGVPGNLNGVLKEVLAEVARVSGKAAPSVGTLILAGHSRAHAFFNPLALLHIDPEMRKGVLASLREVWCLDTTYFAFMAEWLRWLKSSLNLRVSMFFINGSDTAFYGKKFEAAASTLAGGKLVVTRAKETHCKVPGTRLPALLNPSMASVTPEISEEEAYQEERFLEDSYQDEQVHDEREADEVDETDETDGETDEWSGHAQEFDGLSEEEVIGKDERTQVTNTLTVPNRWICAIDVLTDNPDYPGKGPKYLIKSRGTGILIGPRYVLTARHVVGNLAGTATSPIKGLLVSPGRNGDNSTNPLGKVASAAVHGSRPYQVQRTVGGQVRTIAQRDDYALVILDKDVSSSKHSKMKGTLGYWGEDQKVATIKVLARADIDQKDITVAGYPGDTCGTDKWSGSQKSIQNKINKCWNFRNDEWASTQWRGPGTASVDPDPATIFHTADTYEGQSGAPIYLSIGKTLHLAGVHTAPDNAQRNKGVRITLRMLQELADWINADAGSQIANVQNDTLVITPAATGGTTKELLDQEDEEDQEDEGEYLGAVSDQEDQEDYEDYNEREGPIEERFDPNAVPDNVKEARDKKDWPLTVKRAIEGGIRNETDLTNIVFFAQHPELPTEPLKPKEPGKKDKDFERLAAEWNKILVKEVRPVIHKASANASLKVSGRFVAERDPMFSGDKGQQFKTLIEEVSKEADINPGFLAAVLLAEWDRRSLYLSPGEVLSFDTGTDDFFEQRHQLKANVPAFAKVRFDEKRKVTNTNEHGRVVTTVPFETGKDAALASAVYLKGAEIKLRTGAKKNGGDFDAFPVETKFALMRIAMAAGHGGITPDGDFAFFKRKGDKWVRAKKGEKGATLIGVASRLNRVLKGRDILVRKNEPRKDPTGSGHVTNRNATILTAQAMHLSDWIFGIPLETKAQPEADWEIDTMEVDEAQQPDLERTVDEEYSLSESF